MFKKLAVALAFAALAPMSVQAQTVINPDCAVWDPTTNNVFGAGTGYVGCVGSYAGNLSSSSFDAFLSTTTLWHRAVGGPTSGAYALSYLNKSDDNGVGAANNGIFTSNPGPNLLTGTLTFDVAQTGLFGLGLKAGDQFSVYLFNGGSTGILSINFNTSGSGVNSNGNSVNALSHAAFLNGEDTPRLQCVNEVCTTSVVPEPSTYALMATGLLGIFGFARRRRNNA